MCICYLAREAHDDVKKYKFNSLGLDQKSIFKEVMIYFDEEKKWDKMKLCHTYAKYIFNEYTSIRYE